MSMPYSPNILFDDTRPAVAICSRMKSIVLRLEAMRVLSPHLGTQFHERPIRTSNICDRLPPRLEHGLLDRHHPGTQRSQVRLGHGISNQHDLDTQRHSRDIGSNITVGQIRAAEAMRRKGKRRLPRSIIESGRAIPSAKHRHDRFDVANASIREIRATQGFRSNTMTTVDVPLRLVPSCAIDYRRASSTQASPMLRIRKRN